MSWEDLLEIKKVKPKGNSWMVRPPKDVAEWINQKALEHKYASGNKIIVAILKEAMLKDKNK